VLAVTIAAISCTGSRMREGLILFFANSGYNVGIPTSMLIRKSRVLVEFRGNILGQAAPIDDAAFHLRLKHGKYILFTCGS